MKVSCQHITNDNKENRLTFNLLLSIFAAAIGSSFTMGYHLCSLNAPINPIKEWIGEISFTNKNISENNVEQKISFNFMQKNKYSVNMSQRCLEKIESEAEDENAFAFSFLVSIYLIGGLVGGLLSGSAADRFGRKGALLYNIFIGLIANGFMITSIYLNIGIAAYYLFALGRFIVGINSGAGCNIVSIYLNEISPTNLRGSISSTNTLLINIGAFLAIFVGIFLSTENLWPLIIGISIIPLVISFFLLQLCPESPKHYLFFQMDELSAELSLKKLRHKNYNIYSELESLKKEADSLKSESQVSFKQLFTERHLRWPLIIAFVLMTAQQFSGINIVNFYSTLIFQFDAGFSNEGAHWASCFILFIAVLVTIFSSYLVDHPSFGRRPLILIGFMGVMIFMSLLYLVLTILNCVALPELEGWPWNYLAILLLVLFIISFSSGPGAIPWFYVTELFHSNARSKAGSIVSTANWSSNFLVGIGFSPLKKLIGTNIFLVFVVISIFLYTFLFFFAPETKGKTVDQIAEGISEGRLVCRRSNSDKSHKIFTVTQ
ncbi:hypothetical protein ACQ4LE_007255 [Meloidogyne hapla]